MKISDDQNTITLGDGEVLVARSSCNYVTCDDLSACDLCAMSKNDRQCKAPCLRSERADRRDVIFIKEPE